MTSAPAIGFEYRPSRWLPRLLCALALLALVLAGVPIGLKWPLALLVAGLAWRAVRRHRQSPVAAAGWSAEGGWSLRFADGGDVPAVLASFRVLGAVILLRLRTATGEQVLLLAPDNSDADIRRRLRMRLATAQPEQAASRI